MQVNNVRIYLDSSSFPADFLANLLGCSHFRLENQAAWIPIPTRSRPEVARQIPLPTRNTEQLLPVLSCAYSSLLAQVPAAAKKANNYSY